MSYGKSLALSQNSFVRPPTPDVVEAQEQDEFGARRQKRQATVYDAVAGRVNHHGFLPSAPYPSKYRDTASSSTRPVRPEEVLFRRQHAPQRYEENDFYFAHEALPPSCPLPCSELLEAIHAYSADFYDHATIDGGRDDYQSMDETALIAMGILMEEMAKESLGETGDMVLVEGEEIPTDELPSVPQLGRNIGRKRANTGQSSTMASSGDELESVVAKKRRPKKRKLGRKMTSAAELDMEGDERCAKQALIVSHLRATGTCHTLKDLEKMIPSVASINGMQVKEYIQELTDEGRIRVEKIGSGNWYWCFGGEEKKEREERVRRLRREVDRVRENWEGAEARLSARKQARMQEEAEGEHGNGGGEDERRRLMEQKAVLERETHQLQGEWMALATSSEGKSLPQIKEETEEYRRLAHQWTDNIYILEGMWLMLMNYGGGVLSVLRLGLELVLDRSLERLTLLLLSPSLLPSRPTATSGRFIGRLIDGVWTENFPAVSIAFSSPLDSRDLDGVLFLLFDSPPLASASTTCSSSPSRHLTGRSDAAEPGPTSLILPLLRPPPPLLLPSAPPLNSAVNSSLSA
ncbi:meiotic nuclear division protein 1 homolog [Aspergillus awamori]|uniref:Meiotic nuclear division protein 1 homolog n=1 Tax=Aspergillus awamori TaxID=105351 RepID=A0A401KW09_ASPAW|nr:meiotic nuclear division protein 1 homolog [Aspergillus awamori]